MCNGERMKRVADANPEAVADSVDSTVVERNTIEPDTLRLDKDVNDAKERTNVIDESPFFQKALDFIDDDNSESAFEYAVLFFDEASNFSFKDIKKANKEKDVYHIIFFHLKNLCFLLIGLTTLGIIIFSFAKKMRWVYKFSVINLILLCLTVCCIFLEGMFENISQIKWGYYTFILTSLLLFYYAKKSSKNAILSA